MAQSNPTANQPVKAKKRGPSVFYQKLHEMPQLAGIALMVIILVLSVLVGNWRTLFNLEREAEKSLDIGEFVEERIAQASNLLTIAGRYSDISAQNVQALQNAQQGLREAKGATQISEADASLQDSFLVVQSALNRQPLSDMDKDLLQGVVDNFYGAGNRMRQRGKEYNLLIDHAKRVWRMLPFRFLLGEPQGYLGI